MYIKVNTKRRMGICEIKMCDVNISKYTLNMENIKNKLKTLHFNISLWMFLSFSLTLSVRLSLHQTSSFPLSCSVVTVLTEQEW